MQSIDDNWSIRSCFGGQYGQAMDDKVFNTTLTNTQGTRVLRALHGIIGDLLKFCRLPSRRFTLV